MCWWRRKLYFPFCSTSFSPRHGSLSQLVFAPSPCQALSMPVSLSLLQSLVQFIPPGLIFILFHHRFFFSMRAEPSSWIVWSTDGRSFLPAFLFQILQLQLVLSCSASKGLSLPPAEFLWIELVQAGSLGNVTAKTAEISARNKLLLC